MHCRSLWVHGKYMQDLLAAATLPGALLKMQFWGWIEVKACGSVFACTCRRLGNWRINGCEDKNQESITLLADRFVRERFGINPDSFDSM